METEKVLDYCKWSLTGDSTKSSKDQNIDRTVDGKERIHEVSEEKRNSIGN